MSWPSLHSHSLAFNPFQKTYSPSSGLVIWITYTSGVAWHNASEALSSWSPPTPVACGHPGLWTHTRSQVQTIYNKRQYKIYALQNKNFILIIKFAAWLVSLVICYFLLAKKKNLWSNSNIKNIPCKQIKKSHERSWSLQTNFLYLLWITSEENYACLGIVLTWGTEQNPGCLLTSEYRDLYLSILY